jgi:hypothetical protein
MNSARLGHPVKRQSAANEEDRSMISRMQAYCVAIAVLVALVPPMSSGATPIVFEGAGPDATSIQGTVDAFRASLGAIEPSAYVARAGPASASP